MILSDHRNSPQELRRRVRAMDARLVEALDASPHPVPPHDLLATALAELDRYVEALRVTEEALRLQNDVLRACALERDGEQRYSQGLLSLIPDAVLVTDGGGLVREVNPAAARMLGRRPYQMTARSVLAFLPPETRPDFQRELSAGGLIAARCATFAPPRGRPFAATITAVPLPDAAGERRLHWLIRACDRED